MLLYYMMISTDVHDQYHGMASNAKMGSQINNGIQVSPK